MREKVDKMQVSEKKEKKECVQTACEEMQKGMGWHDEAGKNEAMRIIKIEDDWIIIGKKEGQQHRVVPCGHPSQY